MRFRLITACVLLSLAAAACAGSSTDAGVSSASEGVAADTGGISALAFLGALVAPGQVPVHMSIDPAGGELTLGDGTRIVAAEGAFPTTVEVTAQSADLDLAAYFDEAPWAKAYVVSTVESVDLGQPVTIEIARPAAGLRAVQLIEGELRVVPVLGDATARVEIPHFSEVMTMVVEAFNEQKANLPEPGPGAADAGFLRACVLAVDGIFGGDSDDDEQARYAGQVSFSVCTTALVNRASPSGVRVSTACVGDRIGGDVDLRGAIALCADEQTSAQEEPQTPADEPNEDPTVEEPAPEAVDPGPSAWSGNFTLREGSAMTAFGDLTVDLDREAGTDNFTLHMVVGTQSVSNFFEIGECTTVIIKTYDATGTFSDEIANSLAFVGDQFVDWQYPDCDGITENDNLREGDQTLIRITETGMTGGFEGFEFVLDGVPRPIGG